MTNDQKILYGLAYSVLAVWKAKKGDSPEENDTRKNPRSEKPEIFTNGRWRTAGELEDESSSDDKSRKRDEEIKRMRELSLQFDEISNNLKNNDKMIRRFENRLDNSIDPTQIIRLETKLENLVIERQKQLNLKYKTRAELEKVLDKLSHTNDLKDNQNKSKESKNLLKEKTLSEKEKKEAKKFLKGEPVASVKGGVLNADNKGSAIKNAKEWAKQNSLNITREDIGEIVFNERSVQNSLSHAFSQKKLDAVQAVPDTIKHGKILKISKDFNGKDQMNIFIAAPVKIGENKDILFVRLRQNEGDKTRFYVHEVFNVEDIERATLPRPGSTDKISNSSRSIALYLQVLADILNVK